MNKVIKGIKLILSGLLSPFTAVINGIKELMYVGLRVQHIEENLMYDNTPEVLSSKLIDVEHSVKNRMDGLAEVNKSMREKIAKLEDENKTHINCFNGSESSHLLYLIAESERKINEIELSLDSYNSLFNSFKDLLLRVSNIENNMRPKDLGTFNFINDKLTQPELDMIEAEAKGESVAREEYDYTSEQKAKDKQVQDRMRKDEAELIW